MNQEEAITLLKSDVAKWNEYRVRHPGWMPRLDGADLSRENLCDANLGLAAIHGTSFQETNLRRTNFEGSHCRNACLTRTNLTAACLIQADLQNAELCGATLSLADLNSACLAGTNLRGTYLFRTSLTRADLNGTDFDGAFFTGTTLSGVSLSAALNLDKARHQGPSHISVDTIVNSQGKIPEAFLRGCGVPDVWIDYLPSLIGSIEPIQSYSCFISHSNRDHDFCKKLHAAMQASKLRVWFAPEDMEGGKKSRKQIEDTIRVCDKLLLVLSEDSMASNWVVHELRWALKKEQTTGKQVLFPIRVVDFDLIREWECFDSDTGKDLARVVREYHIPDFTKWKGQKAFESAFRKLIADLKSDEFTGR